MITPFLCRKLSAGDGAANTLVRLPPRGCQAGTAWVLRTTSLLLTYLTSCLYSVNQRVMRAAVVLYNTDFPRSGTGPIDQTVICDGRCATTTFRVQRLLCSSRPHHAFSLNFVSLAMCQRMLPVLCGR